MNGKSGALAALLVLMAAGPAFADGSCRPVIAAQVKMFHTPYKSESVMHHDGDDDLVIDDINTADTRYVKMSGSLTDDWEKSALDAAKDEADYRQLMRASRVSCSLERSEAVGGDMADVYVTQDEDTSAVKSRTWISQSSGLPLKIETYLGQGTERPGVSTLTYDYANIAAPAN